MECFGILQQIVPAVFPAGETEQKQVENDWKYKKVYSTYSTRNNNLYIRDREGWNEPACKLASNYKVGI